MDSSSKEKLLSVLDDTCAIGDAERTLRVIEQAIHDGNTDDDDIAAAIGFVASGLDLVMKTLKTKVRNIMEGL